MDIQYRDRFSCDDDTHRCGCGCGSEITGSDDVVEYDGTDCLVDCLRHSAEVLCERCTQLREIGSLCPDCAAEDDAISEAATDALRATAHALAVEAVAADLDPTARTMLVNFDVARDCLTGRGELSCARHLERVGLIAHIRHVATSLHSWRITPDGQAVAKIVRQERWLASYGQRVAS